MLNVRGFLVVRTKTCILSRRAKRRERKQRGEDPRLPTFLAQA